MKKKNIIENYWQDIDSRLLKLIEDGAVKLPSLKKFDLEQLANEISNEMGPLTFKELSSSHKRFLNNIEIDKYLTPKLLDLAQKFFNYKGDLSNQYHIARKVEPGNSKEMYRAHFDSHLFTIVLPIKIPTLTEKGSSGELIYFPNIRGLPNNEIFNFIEKVYYKKYASKKSLEKLSKYHQKKTDSFLDYQPLLFLGKTTLHTNHPVLDSCSSYRLTLLAHFFDDSSKYSIGGLLRWARNR
jgi:hypothetical protein